MKTTTYYLGFLKLVLITLLFLFSINIFAQDTFKVVCDKTDNTVKVIKSDNRSPNYVPIKGGFPFQQIAQQWIDNNFTTTTCNPEEIVKQIQTEQKNNPPTQVADQNKQINQPTQKTQPATFTSATTQEPRYRNTSLIFNAKFSNIGEHFSLDQSLVPGFEVGFEQLFGKKYYVGIGVGMNLYFTDFSSTYDTLDQVTFFFGKIPLFFGYRTYHKKYIFMYEIGGEFNTEFQASDENIEYLSTPNSNSYDIMARFRVGTDRIMVSLGTELWVSEIYKYNDHGMSVFYLGMKYSF